MTERMSDLAKEGLFMFTPFTTISQILGKGDKTDSGKIYSKPGEESPEIPVWQGQVREDQFQVV